LLSLFYDIKFSTSFGKSDTFSTLREYLTFPKVILICNSTSLSC
jgi:hypothetical protein